LSEREKAGDHEAVDGGASNLGAATAADDAVGAERCVVATARRRTSTRTVLGEGPRRFVREP